MDDATYQRLLAKAQRTRDLFTFDDFITFWAKDRPDRIALDGDDLTLTYGELEDATARVASALAAMGIRKRIVAPCTSVWRVRITAIGDCS